MGPSSLSERVFPIQPNPFALSLSKGTLCGSTPMNPGQAGSPRTVLRTSSKRAVLLTLGLHHPQVQVVKLALLNG